MAVFPTITDGLGMRVPMLIVSPYAKEGHVSQCTTSTEVS